VLSYRHSFHAGNFADVIKHIILVEALEHLARKDAAFEYIDTHGGAGNFNLNSSHAQKLGEYKRGIGKLNVDDFPELATYFEVISAFNTTPKLQAYPGSPAIAGYLLRNHDKAWAYELHPKDFELLSELMARQRNFRVYQEDGLEGLVARVPPSCRRGLALIDPSFEVKSEYEDVVAAIVKAHLRFSSGTYALWYPVVDRDTNRRLEKKLTASGIKNIQLFELGIAPDTQASGMTAAGMIVINPPWQLYEKMSIVLPKLVKALAPETGSFRCEVLVKE
jgi:23S rRNA (adenine2030-N6)-methyltransferase